MQADIQTIQKRAIMTVRTGRNDKTITCLDGTLWITQEGDGIDRILTAGDIYQSRISGDIIIEGLDHSHIRISSLQKACLKTFQSGIQPQPACA